MGNCTSYERSFGDYILGFVRKTSMNSPDLVVELVAKCSILRPRPSHMLEFSLLASFIGPLSDLYVQLGLLP